MDKKVYDRIYEDFVRLNGSMDVLLDAIDLCNITENKVLVDGPSYKIGLMDAHGREVVLTVWIKPRTQNWHDENEPNISWPNPNQVIRIEAKCPCCNATQTKWIRLGAEPCSVAEKLSWLLDDARADWNAFWNINNADALFLLADMSDNLRCVRPLVDDEDDIIMPVDDATKFVLSQLKACLANMD